MSAARQGTLALPAWGGARRGAGRPSSRARPALAHEPRETFGRSQPVHVTLRTAEWVWNLRSRRAFEVFERALVGLAERPGFQVIHFSVQGNHVHLLVEADSSAALANGVRALSIRLARGLNRVMGRRGPVFEDRYHAHVLRTPTELRAALRYVLGNHASHAVRRGEPVGEGFVDRYASLAPRRDAAPQGSLFPAPLTRPARGWLLRAALAKR